jgi:hypothetical protein
MLLWLVSHTSAQLASCSELVSRDLGQSMVNRSIGLTFYVMKNWFMGLVRGQVEG